MRRAEKRIVPRATTPVTPVSQGTRGSVVAELDTHPASTSQMEARADAAMKTEDRAVRRGHLQTTIRTRIESRLAGRVRNLVVRIFDDRVVLEGQCATYYTKQLAQHAALGILEDEHLENAIVVDGPP
jgi:hypothetical protein